MVISKHGEGPKWQDNIKEADAYKARVLDTLTAGPVSAAVAGTRAVIIGSGDRAAWEAGVDWAGLANVVGTVVGMKYAKRIRQAFATDPRSAPSPRKPIAADIRPAETAKTVQPRDRSVSPARRGLTTVEPPPPEPLGGKKARKTRPSRQPSKRTPRKRPEASRSGPTPPAGSGRSRGSESDVPIVIAARQANLTQSERNRLISLLVGAQLELSGEIGLNRLRVWANRPTLNQRNAIIDHTAGAVLASSF